MDFRNYRVKSPVKSFRDLEVYQKTIQLSDEITNLPFLNKEQFEQDNKEIKQIAETIPKLIAESYGDKFDSRDIAHKKLTEAITLITNAITKIDLLRQRFSEDKGPAPAPQSLSPLPTLSDINKSSSLDNNSTTSAPPSNDSIPKLPVSEPAPALLSSKNLPKLPDINKPSRLARNSTSSPAAIAGAGTESAEIVVRKSAKEILDNLLTRYQTQKIKVLNLRKAWQRAFANDPQQADRFNYKK